mgnify:CR=1 FL=1
MARKKTETIEELQPEVEAPIKPDHILDAGKMIEPQTVEDDHIADAGKMVQQEKTALAGPTIYAGPTLPGSVLVRYTTFRDGQLRPHIKKLIEQCRAVGKMIVPVSKLAETERKLQDSSSIEAGRFAEILKHFRKGA